MWIVSARRRWNHYHCMMEPVPSDIRCQHSFESFLGSLEAWLGLSGADQTWTPLARNRNGSQQRETSWETALSSIRLCSPFHLAHWWDLGILLRCPHNRCVLAMSTKVAETVRSLERMSKNLRELRWPILVTWCADFRRKAQFRAKRTGSVLLRNAAKNSKTRLF